MEMGAVFMRGWGLLVRKGPHGRVDAADGLMQEYA